MSPSNKLNSEPDDSGGKNLMSFVLSVRHKTLVLKAIKSKYGYWHKDLFTYPEVLPMLSKAPYNEVPNKRSLERTSFNNLNKTATLVIWL